MMLLRNCYTAVYGSMARMPGAVESCYFSLETIWGNFIRRVLIKRDANGKGSLVHDQSSGWVDVNSDGKGTTGRFANLLVPVATYADLEE
jgi:hypothetical protein